MRKLKTKTIPCIVMLIGALATLIITYLYKYTSREMLKVLLISIIACYFVGTLIKVALDRIEIPIEKELEESEEISEEIEEQIQIEADAVGEEEAFDQEKFAVNEEYFAQGDSEEADEEDALAEELFP